VTRPCLQGPQVRHRGYNKLNLGHAWAKVPKFLDQGFVSRFRDLYGFRSPTTTSMPAMGFISRAALLALLLTLVAHRAASFSLDVIGLDCY